MLRPWIENYRGEWRNCDGFALTITPSDELNALVDITHKGNQILRPWCNNTPMVNLQAIDRDEDALGLQVKLGREGFDFYLDYEPAGREYDYEYLSAGISRYEEDLEADKWTSLFGLTRYLRKA